MNDGNSAGRNQPAGDVRSPVKTNQIHIATGNLCGSFSLAHSKTLVCFDGHFCLLIFDRSKRGNQNHRPSKAFPPIHTIRDHLCLVMFNRKSKALQCKGSKITKTFKALPWEISVDFTVTEGRSFTSTWPQ